MRTKLIAAIPAIGFLLDVLFYNRQRAIYDRFYKWWFYLSELNMPAIIRRAVEISLRIDKTLCGQKLTSARSLTVGALTTFAATIFAAFLLVPQEPAPSKVRFVAVFLLGIFNLPVGIIGFFITRILLRLLRFADSLSLAVAIAGVTVMAVEVIVLAFWFCTGAVAATSLKAEYSHGISVNGAVSTFTFLILFAYGYTRGLLHIALVPLYIFASFAILLLIIHGIAKIGVFAERFLAWQVETPRFAAFTVISTAIAATLELTFLALDTVPAHWLLTKVTEGHETAARQTTYNGIKTTWNSFLTEHQKDPALTSYVRQVADGLDAYANKIRAGTEDYEKATKLFLPRVFNYLHKHHPIQQAPAITPSPTPSSIPPL